MIVTIVLSVLVWWLHTIAVAVLVVLIVSTAKNVYDVIIAFAQKIV